jgi:hypothetical protein
MGTAPPMRGRAGVAGAHMEGEPLMGDEPMKLNEEIAARRGDMSIEEIQGLIYRIAGEFQTLGCVAWAAHESTFEAEVGKNVADLRELVARSAVLFDHLAKHIGDMDDALHEIHLLSLIAHGTSGLDPNAFLEGGRAGILLAMSKVHDLDPQLYDVIGKLIPGFSTFTVGGEIRRLHDMLEKAAATRAAA